jgi:hypothetical protein
MAIKISSLFCKGMSVFFYDLVDNIRDNFLNDEFFVSF